MNIHSIEINEEDVLVYFAFNSFEEYLYVQKKNIIPMVISAAQLKIILNF
jgi:hypothetical protein